MLVLWAEMKYTGSKHYIEWYESVITNADRNCFLKLEGGLSWLTKDAPLMSIGQIFV